MSLYDRDYVRDREPSKRSGFAGLRMLSTNTWIIVICVAVFVIDHYTPPVHLPTNNVVIVPPYTLENLANRPLETLDQAMPVPALNPVAKLSGLWAPVVDKTSGTQVGWREILRMPLLESYLHFSTQLAFILPHFDWWRFIGFQFLHANTTHLFFNMLALFFFGPMVEQFLGSKRYLAFYLLCGICGAIMYLILNLGGYIVSDVMLWDVRIPGLLFSDPSTPLVGASAGIFGVLMAAAYIAPRAEVLLFFVLPMQLRTLAYVFVGIAVFTVITGGQNAGGEAGHLGGAIAGFYFIRRQHHLHGFFDFLGKADPTSHHYRQGRRQVSSARSPRRSDEIDRILDKINAQGVQSLSDEEKRVLREASRGE